MDKTFFSINYNRTLGTIVLVALVIALGSYACLTWQEAKYINSGPTLISISGEGEVMAVPDVGQFSFSVVEGAANANEAQSASAAKVNDIIAYLKEMGVEDKDIKTEFYNLSPRWKYEAKPCPFGSYCPQEQIHDGFEVNQTIAIKVRDLEKSGELLSKIGERGATNISSLQFIVDDADRVGEEARALAIADAKNKAEILAKDLGVKLVRIVNFSEGNEFMPVDYMYRVSDSKEESAATVPNIPVGENVIKRNVSITYEVR